MSLPIHPIPGARLRRLAAIALSGLALLASSPATHGSGIGAWDVDQFVLRWGTDLPMDAYANGELGVILPSHERLYRYLAWRAIVLGPEQLKARPLRKEAAERSLGRAVDGWSDPTGAADSPATQWESASAAASGTRAERIKGVVVANGYASYLNCTDGAFTFATSTLAGLKTRLDATPARIQQWVAAQNLVFKHCRRIERADKRGDAAPPAREFPAPLPEAEPLAWRQLREYQVAAARFYAGDLAQSIELFERIGQTPDHPMKQWGAYLALRAKLRIKSLARPAGDEDGTAPPPESPEFVNEVESGVQAILKDPTLAPMHEPARALLRLAQARWTPLARFQALTAELARPDQDPTTDDRLGDWRLLANGQMDSRDGEAPPPPPPHLQRLIASHDFFDWMMAAGPCAEKQCDRNRAHARSRWQQAQPGSAGRRTWLVAALMTAQRLDVALERESRAVAKAAPEYLTVRYNLVRLLRAGGRAGEARAMADEARASLAGKPHSISAENLFLSERFALATSLDDAARLLLRQPAGYRDHDTGESAAATEAPRRIDFDGLTWLNTRLAVADLLKLVQAESLPADLRLNLAVAAWLRADAAGNAAQASQAARWLQQHSPALQPAARAFLAAKAAPARRHVLVLAALKFRLGASVAPALRPEKELADLAAQAVHDADATASMWCKLGKDSEGPRPPAGLRLDVSTAPRQRDAELATLAAVKTATGFVGDHVMQWAKAHPKDPDVPWLLHVVVMSTRGGCLDPDAGRLSRAAHALLHRQYPGDPWTAKTPYFYGAR